MSFAISSFAGLLVNLLIDVIVNATGRIDYFISMPPEFVGMFETPVIAAYVNALLYGVIGATFAMMTFLYGIERLGFVIQSILCFCGTSSVLVIITMILWQLQKYPTAFIWTLVGYGVSFLIMGVMQFGERCPSESAVATPNASGIFSAVYAIAV